MTCDGSTQTDDADSARLHMERLPDRQLHTSIFWMVAKERFAAALTCLAHPALTGPDVLPTMNPDNHSFLHGLMDQVDIGHLMPDITLADARCDLCKHRYFPLRAATRTAVVQLGGEGGEEELPTTVLPTMDDIVEICGRDNWPCPVCQQFWANRTENFTVDSRMQGAWLRSRWPIDIVVRPTTAAPAERVLATVCMECVRQYRQLVVLEAVQPAQFKGVPVKDVCVRARRLTPAGVRSLL